MSHQSAPCPSDDQPPLTTARRRWSARQLAVIPPLLAVIALVAAACGGGSSKASTTSTTAAPAGATATTTGGGRLNSTALQAFRTCLQQHGVTLPTPPTTTPGETFPTAGTGAGGGTGRRFGGGFGGGFGGVFTNPADQSAVQACQSDLPAGFLQQQQQRQQQFTAFISCMKDNGVTITTAAGGNPASLGSIDRTSAAYQKCSVLLPNNGNFGRPGGTGSTTTAAP